MIRWLQSMIIPTDYDEELAFAIANSPLTYQLSTNLATLGTRHGNPAVIVETPDGPLAISHVEEQDGVIKIFTLEG